MNRPELGEHCTLLAKVVKTRTDRQTDWQRRVGYAITDTCWQRIEKRQSGIYIGWRVLTEGTTEWNGDPEVDGSRVFTPTRHFTAWLFVINERQNPIYVLPEDVWR